MQLPETQAPLDGLTNEKEKKRLHLSASIDCLGLSSDIDHGRQASSMH